MKNQQLVIVSANAPHDIECVVDVAGNGKALLPVISVEVKDGRLVIACASTALKPEATAIPVPVAPVVANSEEEEDDGGDEEGGGDEGGGGTMDPPPPPPPPEEEEGGEEERGAAVSSTPKPPAAPTAAATVLE